VVASTSDPEVSATSKSNAQQGTEGNRDALESLHVASSNMDQRPPVWGMHDSTMG
jgi:hypothetical protein